MTLTYADLKAMGATRQQVPGDDELPFIGGITPREEAFLAQADED